MKAYIYEIKSPAGPLAFAVDEDGALMRLHFVESVYGPAMEEDLEDEGYAVEVDQSKTALVRRELSEYTTGKRKAFDVPLAFSGSDAARAVGSANARNNLPVVVPCHRVIAADGTLGGFNGGLHLKERLLEHETRVLAATKR